MQKNTHLTLAAALLCAAPLFAQQGDRKGHDMTDPIPADQIPPAPVLSVDEALASFQVQDGFVLEVVAAEPLVKNPVAMKFDLDGRIWVCEMSSYMPNVDGDGEDAADGVIAVLEDRDGDGQVDTRTEFVNDVVLPRAIAFVPGGILYADQTSLYFAEVIETPDGPKPGLREVADADYAPHGNVEHKPNALLYGMDHWYYSAKSSKRHRVLPLQADAPANAQEIYRNPFFKLYRDRAAERGQWGLSMDDAGRLYHNGNSTPIRGEFLPPNALTRNPRFKSKFASKAYRIGDIDVYPARINPGVNRAYLPKTLHAEGPRKGQLASFTAVSGSVVYRGDNMPERFYGMGVIPEPAGNLISARRIIEHPDQGRLSGELLYPGSEILTSTDERFRPVNTYTAPDGTLYFADMYHGILQHKTYVTSYLRKQILSRDLDKGNRETGRIYRLRWNDTPAGETPKLAKLSAAELVPHLAHPNGWWRDAARQRLVHLNDPTVAGAIESLLRATQDKRAAINAIWTLQGLGSLTPAIVRDTLQSEHTHVRQAAIAAGSHLTKTQRVELAADYKTLAAEAPYPVALWIALYAGGDGTVEGFDALKTVLQRFGDKPYVHEAILSGLAGHEEAFAKHIADLPPSKAFSKKLATVLQDPAADKPKQTLQGADLAAYKHGETLYRGLATCFACHGMEGEGMTSSGPPLAKSEWVTGNPKRLAALMLHGVSGPIKVNGKLYNPPSVMPGLAVNPAIKDADLAAIATYLRNSWGNQAKPVSPGLFTEVRKQTADRAAMYTAEQLNKEFGP